MSFREQHGPPGAETLVKALAFFVSFWVQHGPPGAETLARAYSGVTQQVERWLMASNLKNNPITIERYDIQSQSNRDFWTVIGDGT